ncbi:hypothetical protein, partial [Desulfofundulus sp.]|uniref:hypothetical protein n=1 Tax=Desulfofundulus sp. TaxID=2282750 RepID=UPI003C76569B
MRPRFKRGHHVGLICLAMVISLSALGVGFASWQDGVVFNGVVATGSIEPVFVYCTVEGESTAPGRAEAFVHGDGKKISIRVRDAYPGYCAHFRYRVANLGTV